MPTQATVGKIMQMDPNKGMQLQNNLAEYSQRREQALIGSLNAAQLKMGINKAQHEAIVQVAANADERYQGLIDAGAQSDKAAEITGKERNDAVDNLQKTGQITVE